METLCRLSYRGNERDPMRTGITVAIQPRVSSLTVPPPRKAALIVLPSQATTKRSWWRVRDSNPRSIPRLIYSQLPLAARATRRAPRPSRSVLGSGAARCRGRIASSRRSAPIPAVGAWSHDRTVTRSHSRRRRGGAALRNVPEHPRASAQRSQRLTALLMLPRPRHPRRPCPASPPSGSAAALASESRKTCEGREHARGQPTCPQDDQHHGARVPQREIIEITN